MREGVVCSLWLLALHIALTLLDAGVLSMHNCLLSRAPALSSERFMPQGALSQPKQKKHTANACAFL